MFHYGKHHKGYGDTLNELIAGTKFAELPLEKLIAATTGKSNQAAIYKNATQLWNHTFYWRSLRLHSGSKPPAGLKKTIDASFSNLDACKKALEEVAMTKFGSGWVGLVLEDGKLKVIVGTPLTEGLKALLVINVWEHAYYLDYQYRRVDYVSGVLDKLINCDFAAENPGKESEGVYHEWHLLNKFCAQFVIPAKHMPV